ncbi:MAG: pentapeptide repeat-containing protein, partial [Cyanobacteria bacterium J06642_12]
MSKFWLGLCVLGLTIAAPVVAVEPGAVDRLLTMGECVGCDLEGADLAGLELSQVNLSKANLRQANLVGTDLQQALLQGADLREANLTGTLFADADLRDARLAGAQLGQSPLASSSVVVPNAHSSTVDEMFFPTSDPELVSLNPLLTVAILMGITFTGNQLLKPPPPPPEANPDQVLQTIETRSCPECVLAGADLSNQFLQQVDLRRAVAIELDLNGSDLREASLMNADLRNADLRNANLDGADLTGAQLAGALLHNSTVTPQTVMAPQWRLVHTLVTDGGVELDLTGVDLSGANLRNADLRNANLDGAD